MELVLLFWALLSIAIGVAASQRGRHGLGWFLLALIISPLLAGLFLLLARNLALPGAPSSATHTQCPACAELVLKEARVCKHCGGALVPQLPAPPPTPSAPARKPNVMLGNLYIALAVLFVGWVFYKLISS